MVDDANVNEIEDRFQAMGDQLVGMALAIHRASSSRAVSITTSSLTGASIVADLPPLRVASVRPGTRADAPFF